MIWRNKMKKKENPYYNILSFAQKSEKCEKQVKSHSKSEKKASSEPCATSPFPTNEKLSGMIKLLRDPTGKLYTEGTYKDFYRMTRYRFDTLSRLLIKNSRLGEYHTLKQIKQISQKVGVVTFGFLNKKRRTRNGHIMLILEDKTGEINALIHSRNQDLINFSKSLLVDSLISVKGTYVPSNREEDGIIFVNSMNDIGIPSDKNLHYSSEDEAVALLSDLHIGSREFNSQYLERFIQFLHGEYGNSHLRELGRKVKYILINGDLIDGIGVYPNQFKDLILKDLHQQYERVYKYFKLIPDDVHIVYSPGNHEPVRNAIPRPTVFKKYIGNLLDLNISFVGNPAYVKIRDTIFLLYHGDSILDFTLEIPQLENNNPCDAMEVMLQKRHMAPMFGKKTQIAPTEKDWLIINIIPDVFHTGHMHVNQIKKMENVLMINSGTMQAQTDFMETFGIHPTPGIVPIVELKNLQTTEVHF